VKWTHWILYLVTLPWDLLIAWPVVLIIRLLWGKNLHWETPPPYERSKGGGGGPCLTCQIGHGTFPVVPGVFPKGWYYNKRTKSAWGGTALGHAIFYGPDGRTDFRSQWSRTQAHEHVHVEQFEVAMLQSLIVGVAAGLVVGFLESALYGSIVFLIIWTLGYLLMGIAGWATATLRGEEAYWGSAHEESARAQDDKLAR